MKSLKLGGGSSSSKSSSSFDRTSTPIAPDWIQMPAQQIVGNVADLASKDPLDFFAGVNPLQTQAGQGAAALGTNPDIQRGAFDITAYVGNANTPDASKFVSKYLNPETQNVVDAALRDFDFSAGQTRAQQDLDLAGGGAFQGSGLALTKAATEDALDRGRGSLSANLRSDAYKDALAAAQQEAQLRSQNMTRALAAAGQLGQLATTFGGEDRANIAAQEGTGEALRQIAQEQAQAPLTLQSWASGALPSILSQFFGEHQIGTETGKTKGKSLGFSVGG